MMEREQAGIFSCEGLDHIAITHLPLEPEPLGIVVVPGAPQYRVGAHRLFVTLARRFAHEGWTVLRFDRRGFGDNAAAETSFEHTGAEITAAIDTLLDAHPHLEGVILLGLCDGASATLLHGEQDRRIKGSILINPWVRRTESHAKALLKRHYGSRVTQTERWMYLLRSPKALVAAIGRFFGTVGAAVRPPREPRPDFVDHMMSALHASTHPVLVTLSTNDLTAQEFDAAVRTAIGWRPLTHRNVHVARIKNADHTFTQKEHLLSLGDEVLNWLDEWRGDDHH